MTTYRKAYADHRRTIGEARSVRVPDQVTKDIAFLYDRDQLLGTAFLVAVSPSRHRKTGFLYLVTARHVVEGVPSVTLRINNRLGEISKIPIDEEAWRLHHDRTADVAIAHIILDYDEIYPSVVHVEAFASNDYLIEMDVGVGDDVMFAGLFHASPGTERNLPIVHFGHIARMADELIPVEVTPGHSEDREAFLVEAVSWGGFSGSPVLVTFPPTRYLDRLTVPKASITQEPQMYWALLGLVSGHWNLPTKVLHANAPRGEDLERKALVNAGLALVQPAQQILDLLYREDTVAERKKWIDSNKKQTGGVVLDSALKEPDADGPNEFTRDDFEKSLRRVSRRASPSPPDEASRRT